MQRAVIIVCRSSSGFRNSSVPQGIRTDWLLHGEFIRCYFLLGWVCFFGMGCLADTYAADWVFSPSVAVTEEYDSNVLFTSQNQLSDFRTVLNPEFLLSVSTEQTSFRFDSSTAAEKFLENDGFDTINNDTKLALNHQWSPTFSSELNTRFVKDSTLESQLEQSGIVAARTDRYRYQSEVMNKLLITESVNVSMIAGGGQDIYPDGTFPDSIHWEISVIPSFRVTPTDALQFAAAYESFEFVDLSKIESFQGFLSWEHSWSEKMKFNIGAGYRFTWIENSVATFAFVDNALVLLEDNENSSNSAIVFSAWMRRDWTDRLSTSVLVGRDEFNAADARTYEHNFLRVIPNYLFSDTLSMGCELGYDLNKEISSGEEEISYMRISPFVDWKLRPNTTLKLGGSYEYQDTEASGSKANADRFKTWVGLSWQWPRLWTRP